MDRVLWIIIERFSYSARTSIGRMFFEYDYYYVTYPPTFRREFFGYTLEDTARPDNIKVYGETCIPGGIECDVSLVESPRFGKTIVFHTDADLTLRHGVLSWSYIYAHGGNSYEDTSGCVIVAKNIIDADHVQGSLKNELRIFVELKMRQGYKVRARFVNHDQGNNSLITFVSTNLKRSIMTTTQFWKGLAMALVGVVVAGFTTVPLNWSLITVTLIGTLLVYVGTNAIKVLRPVSIPSTITFRDIVHALLILVGNGILSSLALIVIGTEIDWIALLKITMSISLTYITATLFGGPYSTRRVDWTYDGRLEYNRGRY